MLIFHGEPGQLNQSLAHMPVNSDLFARRAEAILGLISELRAEMGLNGAIREVLERYGDDELHPELKRFSQVVAMARRQALIQQQLDEDREQLHHGNLNHNELVSVGQHYEMLRREACEYNHLLRGLVEASGRYFTRDDLMGWLTSASQGRFEWAKGELTGAVSEMALHAALQGMPEIRNLRYATLEEDLAGYDFVGEWQGKMLTLDAKTGFYRPLNERKHGHRHLEISVPREVVKEFGVTRRGLDLLRHEVRQALHTDDGGREPLHASHHYFRPAHA